MSRLSYWEDAVGEALSEAECFHSLTNEQRKIVAEYIMHAAEMQSEAFGDFCIPDPSVAEKRHVDEAHKAEIKRLKKVADIWKQEGCRVAGVDSNRAYINNCEVWVSRS